MSLRIFLFSLFICLHGQLMADGDADQPQDEAARLMKESVPMIRDALKKRGVDVDQYDFVLSNNTLLVSRDGKPTACYYVKFIWKPEDPLPDLEPDGVDRVTYGYKQNPASRFEVTDPVIIKALVNAWKKHTVVKEHELVEVVMAEEPAFQDLDSHISISVGHGCTLGYRLYRDGELVGGMAGHMEDDPREDDYLKNLKNPVLHALTIALLKDAQKPAP